MPESWIAERFCRTWGWKRYLYLVCIPFPTGQFGHSCLHLLAKSRHTLQKVNPDLTSPVLYACKRIHHWDKLIKKMFPTFSKFPLNSRALKILQFIRESGDNVVHWLDRLKQWATHEHFRQFVIHLLCLTRCLIITNKL